MLFAAFLALDRLPRFYQGDSLAYLTTGLNGWIPPDRSWAYGFASRWLVEGLHSVSVLVTVQAGLLLGAILLLCRAVPPGPGRRWAVPAFAVVAALDPLNQMMARFWLSDTAGAAAFLAFAGLLARGVGAPVGRFRRVVPWLAAVGVFAVFVRVAYAPVMAGLLAGAAVVASLYPARARPPRLRRRMLALLGIPLGAVAMLALANAAVAIPSLRGQVFVNRMSDLYTLGVFLPGLQQQDFVAAGVPITPAEFDGLDRSLDAREAQVWVDGPGHVRWLMMQRMGVDQVYDARFQAACAAVVRAALRRHPQDLALTYLRGLVASLDPARWAAAMHSELGFGLPLPDWTATHLSDVTGRTVTPGITATPSLLTRWTERMAMAYPVLLLAGAAAAVAILALARPFGAGHVLALALLSALLATPLFSHAVKPRYVLAPVLLSELLLVLAVVRPATLRAARVLVRSPALPAGVALACIAAYAGLLGLGRWQTDEFSLLANLREHGAGALGPRLAYSPRPVSELMLALYGIVVNGLERPLIPPFLGLLWLGTLAAAAAAWRHVLPPSRWRGLAAITLAASLFAAVLVGSDVTEAFYWPMAAAAYLPMAAAAAVLAILLAAPASPHRHAGCCVALLVAAGSSEMGAALALGTALAAACDAVARPRGSRAFLRDALWWLLPGVAGACALATTVLVRAHVVELGADTQPYTGKLAASLAMTLRQAALDLADGGSMGPAPVMLAAKLAFAFGAAGLWRAADNGRVPPGRPMLVAAAGLASAAGFSILAAFYHYGTLCCERQGTTRFWLTLLLLLLGARWTLARWAALCRWLDRRAWAAPGLLAASLLALALGRVDGLNAGYDVLALARDARARTWRSGLQPGGAMEFYLPPDGERLLVRGTGQPVGRYDTGPDAGAGTPEMLRELGRYFGKTVVFTCQPWQNEKSWLLNGQFIPACPPHGGPPDIVYPPP